MNNPSKPDNYIPALRYFWLTPFYDTVVGTTTREKTFKNALINQAGFEPGQHVLDLACGTGTLATWIKQKYSGISVTGLDGDSSVLTLAEKKAKN